MCLPILSPSCLCASVAAWSFKELNNASMLLFHKIETEQILWPGILVPPCSPFNGFNEYQVYAEDATLQLLN